MSIRFEDNSIAVKDLIKDISIQFLYEAAGEIEAATKRNSRVDTGQTKNSYSYKVDEDKLEASVGSGLENAIWEEFGTGEYAIEGNGRKGGWFYNDSKGEGHFTVGKKPNRPLMKAYTSNKKKIQERYKSLMKEVGK